MVQAKSMFTILDDVLYLDLDEEMEKPALRQLSHCIRALKPAIDRASKDFDSRTTTGALIAVAVNMAIDHGDPAVIADALPQNAEMLDVEAQLGPSVAPRDAHAKLRR